MELHDDVVQRLALLSIKLASLDKDVPAAMMEAHNELSQLRQGADEAAATLRELSHRIHSLVRSSSLGYLKRLRDYAGRCRSNTGFRSRLWPKTRKELHNEREACFGLRRKLSAT